MVPIFPYMVPYGSLYGSLWYLIFRTTNVLGQRRKEKYIGKFAKEENEILQGSRRIGAEASAVH